MGQTRQTDRQIKQGHCHGNMAVWMCGCVGVRGGMGGYTKKKKEYNLYLTIQLAEVFLHIIVCLPCFEILQLFETGEHIHVNN